jgi:polyhydroxyalkanoate synthesis regulator protein
MAHIEHTITIKQCGGGRLYNTAMVSYVTVEELAGITRSVLKRIIVERAPHG